MKAMIDTPARLILGRCCDPVLVIEGTEGRKAQIIFDLSFASVKLESKDGKSWDDPIVRPDGLRAVFRWLLGGPWIELSDAGILRWPDPTRNSRRDRDDSRACEPSASSAVDRKGDNAEASQSDSEAISKEGRSDAD